MIRKTVAVILLISVFLCFSGCNSEKVENKETVSANPVTDFEYTVSSKSEVGITKYIGTSKNVVIPEKIENMPVVAIWGQPFAYAKDIESVVLPDTVRIIWNSAFSFCRKLKTVDMGNGVTEILDNAFAYCEALESIKLSSSLTSLEWDVFKGCKSLKKVTIPKTLEKWGMNIFCYCPLEEVVFEDGIKNIGAYACFWGPNLTEITIPASVENIGEYSFHNTENKQLKITFLGDAPKSVGKLVFGKDAVIYRPKNAKGWDKTNLAETYQITAQ